MVETFKVIVAEGSTLGRHDAMGHAVTEIHPNIIATSLLAVDSKPWCHRHKARSVQRQTNTQYSSTHGSLLPLFDLSFCVCLSHLVFRASSGLDPARFDNLRFGVRAKRVQFAPAFSIPRTVDLVPRTRRDETRETDCAFAEVRKIRRRTYEEQEESLGGWITSRRTRTSTQRRRRRRRRQDWWRDGTWTRNRQ